MNSAPTFVYRTPSPGKGDRASLAETSLHWLSRLLHWVNFRAGVKFGGARCHKGGFVIAGCPSPVQMAGRALPVDSPP